MKMITDLRNKNLFLIVCAIIAVLGALLCAYSGYRFLTRLALQAEGEKAWGRDYYIDLTLRNIENAKYGYAACKLRELKSRAEIFEISKMKYLEAVNSIKEQIPAKVPDSSLPFDLREGNEGDILYGLIPGFRESLSNTERETEMQRICAEIRMISGGNGKNGAQEYRELLIWMRKNEFISQKDIDFIYDHLAEQPTPTASVNDFPVTPGSR